MVYQEKQDAVASDYREQSSQPLLYTHATMLIV